MVIRDKVDAAGIVSAGGMMMALDQGPGDTRWKGCCSSSMCERERVYGRIVTLQ